MPRRYNLLLINPRRGFRYHWDLLEMAHLMGKKTVSTPLALPLLAALTPDRYTITIIDEDIDAIPKNFRPDIVGITTVISNAERALLLADTFMKSGIPVIMGGPHASFSAQEFEGHCSSIAIGEAEDIWPSILADFELGSLKPRYESTASIPFTSSPRPRWDLANTKRMLARTVQASRGCPFTCDFCLVRKMFGGEQRYRCVSDVIDEIRTIPRSFVINFADDNLMANKVWSKEFLAAITPLKRSWSCQSSIETAFDTPLLKAMAAAGCTSILIGFESLDNGNLRDAGKKQNNADRFTQAIANIHAAGIHIIASFVVGFDNDTPETLHAIEKFTEENNLCYVMINALFAYEGTDFHARMKKEKRLTAINGTCSGLWTNVIPKNMSQKELFEMIVATQQRIYSFGRIATKSTRLFSGGSFSQFIQPAVTPLQKLATVLYIVRAFVCASTDRRTTALSLFRLIKMRRLPIGVAIQHLLFVDSFNSYLDDLNTMRDTIIQRGDECQKIL